MMLSVLSVVSVIIKPLALLMVETIGQLCCRQCRGPKAAEALRARRREALAAEGRLRDVCAICLEGLDGAWAPEEMGDFEVEIRACKHAVHLPCMTEWIKSNNSCPVCPNVAVVDQFIVRRRRRSGKQ